MTSVRGGAPTSTQPSPSGARGGSALALPLTEAAGAALAPGAAEPAAEADALGPASPSNMPRRSAPSTREEGDSHPVSTSQAAASVVAASRRLLSRAKGETSRHGARLPVPRSPPLRSSIDGRLP